MANLVVKPQVEFIEAIKLAFKKSFTFTGRIRRSEFWWAELGIIILAILTSWIPIAGQLFCLYLGIVNLAMTFRRLHDTNHSGWWVGIQMLIGVIAIILLIAVFGVAALNGDIDAMTGASIGSILLIGLLYVVCGILELVVLVFCCMDSQQIENKYGESPKYVLE